MATTSRTTANINVDDHRTTTIMNLSKLINQELDLLEESFQEAKTRVEQVIAQVKEARYKYDQLQQQQAEKITRVEHVIVQVKDALYMYEQLQKQQGEKIIMELELRELKKIVGKLKSKIPFDLIAPEDQPNPIVNWRPLSDPRKPMNHHASANVPPISSSSSNHPLKPYVVEDLSYFSSQLLLYFFVFPKNAVLKKSLLLYCPETTNFYAESDLMDAMEDLISKGFVKPVYKKCGRIVSGYWMNPVVRDTLSTTLSRRMSPYHSHISRSASTFFSHVQRYRVQSIDENDIIYSGSPQFRQSKDLKFLHLGKWQRSSTHHIEMEDSHLYFKNFKNTGELRYISFRGISMIKELPEDIKLFNLQVLDLKACHNLEAIPSDIGYTWERLTHLDMSECYFLDHMPATLSRLYNLRVLKGFYVGESNRKEASCTLQDLSLLKDLMKLNIYTSVKEFPSEDQVSSLQDIKSLRKLTISWGGSVTIQPQGRIQRMFTPGKAFPFKLEKLDLQCVPSKVTRHWLEPSNFNELEKFYIRGGQFNDFGKDEKDKGWRVETLRLKHLGELRMDWSEIDILFPKLIALEKVDCPNLTSFPCDESGLWVNTTPPPSYHPSPDLQVEKQMPEAEKEMPAGNRFSHLQVWNRFTL